MNGYNIFYFKPMFFLRDLFMHLLLSLVIFVLPDDKVLLPVIVFLTLFYAYNRNIANVLIVGIYALYTSSELVYYGYSLSLLGLLLTGKSLFRATPPLLKPFFYLLIYLMASYVIQIFFEGSWFSFPFFILTFISPGFIAFYVFRNPLTYGDLEKVFRNMLALSFAQAIIAFFLQAVPKGIGAILATPTYGDMITGTTSTAPSLAILLFFSILPYIMNFTRTFKMDVRSLIFVSICVFYIFLIYLNDSKTELYAIIISFGVISALRYVSGKNVIAKVFLLVAGILVFVSSLSFLNEKFLSISKDYDDYITGKYNAKFLYFASSLDPDTRPLYQYVFGSGPGTNGSRAANALAYDVLFKRDNAVTLPSFVPAKSNTFTKKYLSKYFDDEYAKDSGGRSAILGNPFNSMCALFIEFGVVGYILYLLIIGRIFLKLTHVRGFLALACCMLIGTNFITAFIDQTLERVVTMHLQFFLMALALKELYYPESFLIVNRKAGPLMPVLTTTN